MKKLYTILAVAALALGVNAATIQRADVAGVHAADKGSLNIEASYDCINLPAASAKTFKAPAKAQAAAATAASAAELEGIWSLSAIYVDFDAMKWTYGALGATQISVIEGNKVSFAPFIYTDIELTGDFDPATQKITISLDPIDVELSSGTVPVHMYLYDFDAKVKSNVVFDVDMANHEISVEVRQTETQYLETILLGRADVAAGSGIFDQFAGIFMDYTNSVMYNETWDQSKGDYVDEVSFMYAEVKDGNLVFKNFYDFGFETEVTFELDNADKTATAHNQVIGTDSNGEIQMWSFDTDGNLSSRDVTMEYLTQEGVDFFYSPGMFIGYSTGQYAGYGYIPEEIMIVLNFDPFNTSVSEISVADENAPVEYFNLQGVRVANPENGLYIRRQGNTVTKVLVK